MKLTDRELATVLAALRFWQSEIVEPGDTPIPEIENISTNGGKHERLYAAEIDDLCERLNRA